MEKCKRVRYKNSPLLEVIFQLRFPTILTINANPPVEFQEKIRNEFPYYNGMIENNTEKNTFSTICKALASEEYKKNFC